MSKDTSCKATKAIIMYIRNRAEKAGKDPHEAVKQLLTDFAYPSIHNPYDETYLTDTDNWVDLETSDELFERAKEVLCDEDATYKIAAATWEPQFRGSFGVTERLARLAGTRISMGRTPNLNRDLTQTSVLRLLELTNTQAKIEISYKIPYKQNLRRHSCDFARGILSVVPQFAGSMHPAKLNEIQCCLPIYKRGIIDGYFYVKDSENQVWMFEWPFEESDDQIPLPVQSFKKLDGQRFIFDTRQGEKIDLRGEEIGIIKNDVFEWRDVRYGAENCVYHFEWTGDWLSRLTSSFNRFTVSRKPTREDLLDQLHSTAQEVEELRQVDRTINSTLDLADVLQRILDAALNLTKGQMGRVLLIDPETGELAPYVGKIMTPQEVKSEQKVSFLDIDKVIGEIQIQCSEPNAFGEDDERKLTTLAGQAVIAIKNAQQYEELSREKERRANAEILTAMADLSGKMVHRMRGYLGGARSDIEEIRTDYINDIRQTIDNPTSHDEIVENLNIIEELLDNIHSDIGKALEMVDNLRKPFKIDPGPVSLEAVVKSVLSTLDVPSNVTINVSTKSMSDLPLVRGSLDHLSEMFHILLTNAIDAIGESDNGKITINCSVQSQLLVKVMVIDNGVGMNASVRARIFSYGYTTKETEKTSSGGYGFGLWWVKNYLQRIHGDIQAQSTPEQGTLFTLLLPVWSNATGERETDE